MLTAGANCHVGVDANPVADAGGSVADVDDDVVDYVGDVADDAAGVDVGGVADVDDPDVGVDCWC